MKNLKRLLSLALTGVMLSGMMVMGANAAFPDADEIVNVEAVNTMVALNIINGKDNGNFDPEGLVTRAEMAKMIAVAVNGGVAPEFGVKTVPTFTDIKGHWAEQFIEYCSDMKYINGRGNGTFDPNGNVTGIEAAKMVLTALGYDAEAYQLVGADWAINVSAIASRTCKPVSLYENLSGTNLNAPATRDTAAQMLWNGLQNYTVEFTPNLTIVGTGLSYGYHQTEETLLKHAYGAEIKYGIIDSFEYDEDTKEFTYTIDSSASYIDSGDKYNTNGNAVTTKEDLTGLYKQQVQIVYKPKNNKIDTLYGVSAHNSTIMGTEILGNIPAFSATGAKGTDTKIKINGTTYRVENDLDHLDVEEFVYGTPANADLTIAANTKLSGLDVDGIEHFTMDIIDQDGNGKADICVIHPVYVGKVNSVGKTSISTTVETYKFENADIYEDVAKGDWTVITKAINTATNAAIVAKAEILTEVVDEVRDNDDGNADNGAEAVTIRVDGTWYTDTTGTDYDDWNEDNEYDLVILNGYVFHAEATEEAVNLSNIALVIRADAPITDDDVIDENTQRVKLGFSDGSTKTVIVTKVNNQTVADEAGKKAVPGTLYTYTVSGDDYKLTTLASKYTTAAGYTIENTPAELKDGKLGAVRFNSGSTVFVLLSDGTFKVIDGAAVAAWAKQDAADFTGVELYAKSGSSNFKYVTVGALKLADDTMPNEDGNLTYGYITTKGSRVTKNKTTYVKATVWTADGEMEILAKTVNDGTDDYVAVDANTLVSPFAARTLVSFEDLGNGYVGNLKVVADKSDATSVIAYEGDDISFFAPETYNLTLDTKLVTIYVDSEKLEGYEDGAIQIASYDTDTNDKKSWTPNVLYVLGTGDDAKKVKVLVVDVNNEIYKASAQREAGYIVPVE